MPKHVTRDPRKVELAYDCIEDIKNSSALVLSQSTMSPDVRRHLELIIWTADIALSNLLRDEPQKTPALTRYCERATIAPD